LAFDFLPYKAILFETQLNLYIFRRQVPDSTSRMGQSSDLGKEKSPPCHDLISDMNKTLNVRLLNEHLFSSKITFWNGQMDHGSCTFQSNPSPVLASHEKDAPDYHSPRHDQVKELFVISYHPRAS